jgi:di/tricarboxylate transporter
MLGASAAFVLPYGYQCNLMVMAAGKYKTAEFIRIGFPFQVRVQRHMVWRQRVLDHVC